MTMKYFYDCVASSFRISKTKATTRATTTTKMMMMIMTILMTILAFPWYATALNIQPTTMADRKPIPVTVISGFLGSGKTTLLQNMLQNKEGLKIGLVVNDVASVNIDSKLLMGREETATSSSSSTTSSIVAAADGLVELSNGCACCSLSDELIASVRQLLTISELRKEKDQFDHIVVEMSGVADPKQVRAKFQRSLTQKYRMMDRVKLDTMVTLIDSSMYESYFRSSKSASRIETPELFFKEGQPKQDVEAALSESLSPILVGAVMAGITAAQEENESNPVVNLLVSQTETADLLVLNKEDLVDQEEMQKVKELVSAFNPRAKIITSSFGNLPIKSILAAAGGKGIADHGAVEDHRDYVNAADTTIEAVMSSTTSIDIDDSTKDCIDPTTCDDPTHSHSHSHAHDCAGGPDCTDPSSHSHSHDHQECSDPDCTDTSHSHSHSHEQEACSDPDCTDTSHSHSHSHEQEACSDPDCTDTSHSHSHSHEQEACSDPDCTDTSHSHSHSHDEEACSDPDCSDPSHSHSHSHNHDTREEANTGSRHKGIGSFVYKARRPFHPARLASFLRYLPVVRGLPAATATDDNNESSTTVITISENAKKALQATLRSKGFVWSADSHNDALYWSHAGSSFELSCLGSWWATLPREYWPVGTEEKVLPDYDNPDHDDFTNPVGVGDRRQEIVFIGLGFSENNTNFQIEIRDALSQCLLNDTEYDEYKSMQSDETKLQSRFSKVIQPKTVVNY